MEGIINTKAGSSEKEIILVADSREDAGKLGLDRLSSAGFQVKMISSLEAIDGKRKGPFAGPVIVKIPLEGGEQELSRADGTLRMIFLVDPESLDLLPDYLAHQPQGLLLPSYSPGDLQLLLEDLGEGWQGAGSLSPSHLVNFLRQGRDLFTREHITVLGEIILQVLETWYECDRGVLLFDDPEVESRFEVVVNHGLMVPSRMEARLLSPGFISQNKQLEPWEKELLDQSGLSSAMWSPFPEERYPSGVCLLGRTTPGLERRRLESLIYFSAQISRLVQYMRLRDLRRLEKEQLLQAQQMMVRDECLSTIGRLMTSVAHEINNPLQAIQLNLELADRDAVSDSKRRHFLSIVRREVSRLRGIVADMLEYYRPGQSSKVLASLNDLIQQSLELMQPRLACQDIDVRLELADQLPEVNCFPDQIQQVLINLIANAVDAMPEGGRLTVRTEFQKERAHCMIKDTGGGIPRQHLDYLFDPFFSTKENHYGLGLTICDNIVSQHKGKIEVKNTSTQGTCVIFELPIGG